MAEFTAVSRSTQRLDLLLALACGAVALLIYLLTLAPGSYAASVWTDDILVSATLLANVEGDATQAFANVFALNPVAYTGTASISNNSTAFAFTNPQTISAGTTIASLRPSDARSP